jgi:Protein of unknown function (DUF3251)
MKSFLNGWGAVALLILPLAYIVYSCDGHDQLNHKIRELRKDVRELKGASVSLNPGSNDYQVIRHQLGSATLSLNEVKAHDKGSAITLEIGNLISVHITGAAMTIGYQDPSDPSVESSLKYDVKQTLEAGKSTKVTLILEGVNPSAVTYIRVSDFQPRGIRLIQAN